MKTKKVKPITPEEKKYLDICALAGVDSLTELRFIARKEIVRRPKLGRSAMKYITDYMTARGLEFGNHTLQDYTENKAKIWADATGIIVFKYKVRSVLSTFGICNQWAVGEFIPAKQNYGPFGKPKISFRGISQAKAAELIETRGLELVTENKDGIIFEAPDGRFLKQFGAKGCDLSRAAHIDTTPEKEKEEQE